MTEVVGGNFHNPILPQLCELNMNSPTIITP